MSTSIPTKPLHIHRLGALLVASLVLASPLHATQSSKSYLPADTADARRDALAALSLQATGSAAQPRHELGAVVDVRQASQNGVTVLAITPGGAAERMGLQPGDQLRSINGRRLDDTAKPATTFDSAMQESDGTLQLEVVRGGKTMRLSGRTDLVASTPASAMQSCGYVTANEGTVPESKGIFHVEITQVEGRSTPLTWTNRHRVAAGKRVLVVREFIDHTRLNSAQLLQIKKMKKFAFARAYKSLVLDVQPGMSYRIGARLIKDKLDTQSIRDNAYWEPVVWEVVPQPCP